MSEITQTDKQAEIMGLVLKAADGGEILDIDQLKERLSYGAGCTKQAIQCSIRFLEGHGMLVRGYEKRRRCRRMILRPTAEGYAFFRARL